MTPDTILRWGLLSTARINRSLIPPLRASPRNRLVAVASRDPAKAEAYAREWNIERAFGSYEALLESPEIDVVYISLPNSLHAEWTIKALRAGKHVLCEKPLTTRVEDADAIAVAAQEAGKVVAEAFMYRHHPQTLKVKSLIECGAIGEVRLVRGAFTFTLTDRANVRVNAGLDGGCVWDVGCYPISYARTMIGAEPVEAFGMQFTGPSGVDETFVGTLRFGEDVYAQFDCGFRAPFRMHMEIVGSEGLIVIPRPFKPTARETIYIGKASDQLEPMAIEGPELLYLGEVEDMADAILNGAAPRISLHDSRANVAAILALLRSAREGRPVKV
ncbi:MAG: Gfo/Idh/MocA family oxidoreductase [Anaerolineae bacterium]|nr:Gfo/Idh/MocA family oxidoreductase [Candidatus Roseilinea sp.]MDW8451550.1 Gfo/Idh/MocA family oxidoreductase [Anaerolineae bacterium]